MKNINENCIFKIFYIFTLVLLINPTTGLYEDQIKKFDWKLQLVGKVDSAAFIYENSRHNLIVSTADNVIASLSLKSGDIQWRQVLEKSPRGDVKLFKVLNDRPLSNVPAKQNANSVADIITVQGSSPAIVRGWSVESGNLEWEWSLVPMQAEQAEDAQWFLHSNYLYHVIPVWGSHFEMTAYLAGTGQVSGTTSRITAPWIKKGNCVLVHSVFNCADGAQLLSINLAEDSPTIDRTTLPIQGELKSRNSALFVENRIISFVDNADVCPQIEGSTVIKTKFNRKDVIFRGILEGKVLKITALYADSCEQLPELSTEIAYPENYGTPEFVAVTCSANNRNSKGCRFVFSTADEAVIFVKGDKIEWIRDESLSNIIVTEFVDFPLADSEGTLESELNSKTGDVWEAFCGRVSSQFHQLRHALLHVLGLGQPLSATQKAGLVRDAFGLHKMLVVVTDAGKVFGIDNLNAKIHWMRYLPSIQNFNNGEVMKLVIQRTSKHFPLQPVCTIIASNTNSGNGVLYTFNPITGVALDNGLNELDHKIRQFSVLREKEGDFIKGILLLDEHNELHVIPESTKEMAADMYLFSADKKHAILNGYFVKLIDNSLSAEPIWNVRLGGHNDAQKIIAVNSKNPIERIHSQGRVLGDRSVLYKYINPNLVAVVTEGLDSVHKYILNVYLIDAVTGSIVFSMTHRRVRGPINIVHSENWLTYTYYNEKVRRTELTSVELYEGKVQSNSSVWSSLDAPPMPLVEKQTYILPSSVEALKETITERGITNKHVLIGTTSGSIVEMPWVLLDPRRPVTAPNQPREEGIIPYIPELPFPPENTINYNQTIVNMRNIFTSPSGLESTCLVVATGLDVFVTRVSPSKTFDLLKEDFDYFLITMVLIALTTGSLFAKQLSARKMLRQAWK